MTKANFLILAACMVLTACGKRSEQPALDLATLERLYVACVTQPDANPSSCRYNAAAIAERGAQ